MGISSIAKTVLSFILMIAGFALVWDGVGSYLPVLPPIVGILIGILVLVLAAWVVGKKKTSLIG